MSPSAMLLEGDTHGADNGRVSDLFAAFAALNVWVSKELLQRAQRT